LPEPQKTKLQTAFQADMRRPGDMQALNTPGAGAARIREEDITGKPPFHFTQQWIIGLMQLHWQTHATPPLFASQSRRK